MSDRTVSLTVVLDNVYRVDDAEEIMRAISMMKGVIKVGANIADPDTYVAYQRVRLELREKLFKALEDK